MAFATEASAELADETGGSDANSAAVEAADEAGAGADPEDEVGLDATAVIGGRLVYCCGSPSAWLGSRSSANDALEGSATSAVSSLGAAELVALELERSATLTEGCDGVDAAPSNGEAPARAAIF